MHIVHWLTILGLTATGLYLVSFAWKVDQVLSVNPLQVLALLKPVYTELKP
jgi:hypothetical protein